MGREDIDASVRRGDAALIGLRVVEFIQQADVVPALLAPGRQQGVGVLVQVVRIGQGRQFWMGLAPLTISGEQITVTDDIGPIEFAGVMDTKHHLADPAEDRQRFQRLLGQR